ncbi:MAG: type II secretion system protein GspL [Thiobacillaceae bacterium]
MSELRLYLRRDTFVEGTDCAWALLDDKGHLQSSGNQLVDLPRSRHCHLVLASDLVLTLKTPLPDLPERRLAPLLPAAAEAATLVEADTIHAVIMDHPGDGDATLAVVEEAWLTRILSKLAGLGLHPDSALPEYLLLPWTEDGWSVGWRSNNSVARFSKSEGMSLDDGEPPVGLILALAQRKRPAAIKVYLGETAGSPDWKRWSNALEIAVEAAGPWDWHTVPWPELPGLLQGKHAPGLKRLDWTRLARPVVWGAVSLAAIQLAGLTLDWALLARENTDIKQEMHVLAERALPASSAIVDPPWQVRERLQNMQTAIGNPAPNALVGLIGRLSQAWPKLGNTQVQTLSYEGDALNVSIAEADAAWLDQLKAAATAQGLTVNSRIDKDNGKAIQLTIRPAAKGGS